MPSAVWASASSMALITGLQLYVLLANAENTVIKVDALLIEDNGQSLVIVVPLETLCVAATERHDLTEESVGYKLVRVPSESATSLKPAKWHADYSFTKGRRTLAITILLLRFRCVDSLMLELATTSCSYVGDWGFL